MTDEKVKRGDFVELDYTAKVKNTGDVFDTTNEEIAKAAGVNSEGVSYGPVIVCIGKRHVLKGLDEKLIGTAPGQHYVFFLKAEEAFGNRDPRLLQLVSTNKFRKQEIFPFPGLQVSFEGVVGTVKSVTGGRTAVDFNHPLAGKELEYEVTVKRIVTDDMEKAEAILKLTGIKAAVRKGETGLIIEPEAELPEEIKEQILKELEETGKIAGAIFADKAPAQKEEQLQPASQLPFEKG